MVQQLRFLRIFLRIKNFNTSYVMVQLVPLVLISPCTQDFNTSYVMVQPGVIVPRCSAILFQYILCYGSTIAGM